MMCLSHLPGARTLARDGLQRSTNGALPMERFVVDLGLPRGGSGGSFGRIHAFSCQLKAHGTLQLFTYGETRFENVTLSAFV